MCLITNVSRSVQNKLQFYIYFMLQRRFQRGTHPDKLFFKIYIAMKYFSVESILICSFTSATE